MRNAVASVVLVACSSYGSAPSRDAPAPAAARPASPDATTDPPPPPFIGDALGCGQRGEVGSLQSGADLARVDVDRARFPEATCNDGSGATFFVRSAATPGAKNRWLIHLSGGGNCRTAADCAARWCSAETNFGMQQMSSTLLPEAGIVAAGITERRSASSFGDWNHVYVPYCSSDDWSGTARDVRITTEHPVTRAKTTFRMHFSGASILDAVIATLRRDGAGVPRSAAADLADLDDAEMVVLAGASAGGAGVRANLDRVAALLRARNTRCQGAGCPLQIAGLVDSSYALDLARLDFSTSTTCRNDGLCDYPSYVDATVVRGSDLLWKTRDDESCHTWHRVNDPGREWMCGDATHVLRNHVTTPFFLRMGQLDQLHVSTFVGARFSVPNRGVLTLPLFADLVRTQLGELALLPGSAEEGAAMLRAPGVYAPACPKHDTLRSHLDTYDVRVLGGGVEHAMFDVFELWKQGGAATTVIAQPGDPIVCPQ